MAYASKWERLDEALRRVMAASGVAEEGAKADICRAIADGAVDFRGKLCKHISKPMTSDAVLERDAFEIPHELKPEGLDWQGSRPFKAWVVRRERYRIPGPWELEWIELSSLDVTEHLCRQQRQGQPAQHASSERGEARRRRPALERARQALAEVYSQGVPTQAIEPNALLCRRVGTWLRDQGLPDVSDDTILRAAGRRN
jgi:hypothetical protein